MSILKDIINEFGSSTGSDSIASNRGSLFGGGHIDPVGAKRKKRRMMRRAMSYSPIREDISSGFGNTNFDPSDVFSKIDAAQRRAQNKDDTTAFGLEDENGNIIKVYVKSEQAEDFEKALGDMLAGADSDDDQENTKPEIAEVLFKLKDRFDFVDAEWPQIETDEEEEQEVGEEGAEGEMGAEGAEGEGEEGAEGGEEGEGAEGEGEEGAEGGMEDAMGADMGAGMGGEEAATSALQSVIDVLKSDAEAKKAEADARTAEARAKEAEYAAAAAAHKVKQEEQILDMEARDAQQKSQEQEAKKLAQLARYQHSKASEMEGQLGFGNEVRIESQEAISESEEYQATLNELKQLVFEYLRGGK